ncbi:MAG: DUF3048 domain-containing protein [Bacillota bacterium]|nr:DUF3048 domain-containing protein [Bacillota bacterium]
MKTFKKLIAVAIALMACFVFASCSVVPAPSPSVQTSAPSETPASSPTTDPALISPTTGLPYSGVYQPVAVVINNHLDARPQSGLQAADVVYEVTVEASITRFLAIFNDNLPEKVGSVRSSRVSIISLWKEWDCIFVHWGGEGDMDGPNRVKLSFNTTGIKIRVDGMVETRLMFRDDSNVAPHNGFANVAEIAKLYDYQPEPHYFFFDKDADLSSWAGVNTVSIPYNGGSAAVKYMWDASKNAFLRFTMNKPHKDKLTGEQITVTNIIVMYMDHRTLPDREHHVLITNKGHGKCIIFRNGKYIEGTWEKASEKDSPVFKDASGNELSLDPGNTWINIVKPNAVVNIE